tara:strand:+ start:1653 stop:1793 length:141 start_codon:yes stop_codon:yes gene_type:complete
MKTLINKDGKFLRATDRRAISLVKSGEWNYCSKSEWKEKSRDLDKE